MGKRNTKYYNAREQKKKDAIMKNWKSNTAHNLYSAKEIKRDRKLAAKALPRPSKKEKKK